MQTAIHNSGGSHTDKRLRSNQRRRSQFILPAPKHLVAATSGALIAAVAVHYLGFLFISRFDVGLHISKELELPRESTMPEKIVLQADPSAAQEIIEIPDPPAIEQIEEIPAELPDLEDMPLEEVVLAPGETQIALEPISLNPPESLTPQISQLTMQAVAKGMPAPATPEPLKINPLSNLTTSDTPATLPADEWYMAQVKGMGGVDDSHLPDGSKSLSQLLAQPNLGKNSGYSRLGADLLFEYNKATLRQSAHQSMMQLAGLILKNPDTIFIVEGHTDSFGSAEYNTVLSLMRANAVRQWLLDNNIPLTNARGQCRFFIRGCAATNPVVAVDQDKNGQAPNRRVEIHMRKPGESLPEGCLAIDQVIDMNTPIVQQIKQGVVHVTVPQVDTLPQALPIPQDNTEDLPQAEPVYHQDDTIPDAMPLSYLSAFNVASSDTFFVR